MAIPINLVYHYDIKRLTFPINVKYSDFRNQLITTFQIPPSSAFSIKYEDEEGDKINITTDLELQEAFSFGLRTQSLNVYITEGLSNSSAILTAASPPSKVTSPVPSSSPSSTPAKFQSSPASVATSPPSNKTTAFNSPPTATGGAAAAQAPFVSFSQMMNNTRTTAALMPQLLGAMQMAQTQQPLAPSSQPVNPQQNAFAAFLPLLASIPREQLAQIIVPLLSSPAVQQLLPQLLLYFSQSLQNMNAAQAQAQAQAQQSQSNSVQTQTQSSESQVFVSTSTTATPVDTKATQVDCTPRKSSVIHSVQCKICLKQIIGARYKCTVCKDYDMCEICENKDGSHPEDHPLMKFKTQIKDEPKQVHLQTTAPTKPNLQNTAQPIFIQPQPFSMVNSNNLSSKLLAEKDKDDITCQPSVHFTKTWSISNNGLNQWPEGTRLVFVGGEPSRTVNAVEVPSLLAGGVIDISVDFIAPSLPGKYVSYWRLHTDNSPFGDRLWLQFTVEEPKPSNLITPTLPSVPAIAPVVTPVTTKERPSTPPETENKPVTPVESPKQDSKPTSPLPSEPVTQFNKEMETLLGQLAEMGFTDRALNMELLVKYSNDAVKVVQDLLNRSDFN